MKGAGGVTLAKLTISSQDSPNIGNIVQGQLTLPKLLVFRDGEAMDFDGEPTQAGMVEVMMREQSRIDRSLESAVPAARHRGTLRAQTFQPPGVAA